MGYTTSLTNSKVPLRIKIPLQRRKVLKKTLGGVIKILIVCGLITFFMIQFLFDGWEDLAAEVQRQRTYILVGWMLCIASLIVARMAYQILYFVTYFYDINDKNVVIRKGVIIKTEITLPFTKISDVYVDQDPFDFLLAIYDVHISTPTAESGIFAHIDGVNKKGAAELRQMILDRINKESSGKDLY